MSNNNLVLARYYQDYGRMGELGGDFVCTLGQLSLLKDVGSMWWSDKLGKHSESKHTFNDDTLKVISSDNVLIKQLLEQDIIQLDGQGFVYNLEDSICGNDSFTEEEKDKLIERLEKEMKICNS